MKYKHSLIILFVACLLQSCCTTRKIRQEQYLHEQQATDSIAFTRNMLDSIALLSTEISITEIDFVPHPAFATDSSFVVRFPPIQKVQPLRYRQITITHSKTDAVHKADTQLIQKNYTGEAESVMKKTEEKQKKNAVTKIIFIFAVTISLIFLPKMVKLIRNLF